jgi:hypothetical protein
MAAFLRYAKIRASNPFQPEREDAERRSGLASVCGPVRPLSDIITRIHAYSCMHASGAGLRELEAGAVWEAGGGGSCTLGRITGQVKHNALIESTLRMQGAYVLASSEWLKQRNIKCYMDYTISFIVVKLL